MSGATAAIFSLYEKWGGEHYIGERVTQLQHAQQVPTFTTGTNIHSTDQEGCLQVLKFGITLFNLPPIFPSNCMMLSQAAVQAEKAGYGAEVVIGAFLHDIGNYAGQVV